MSVGPAYTFYNSRETGCQFIRNSELLRVCAEVKIRRFGSACSILFELEGGRRIKCPGSADLFRLRVAYDTFCPRVLVGEKGRELDREKLALLTQSRKKAGLIGLASLIAWSVVFQSCLHMTSWLGVCLLAGATLIELAVCVLLIRAVQRAEK